MSLLVVGSVAFDGLESPYGKVDRTLGGAATYFAVAASFFTPVTSGCHRRRRFHRKGRRDLPRPPDRLRRPGARSRQNLLLGWTLFRESERARHADDGVERFCGLQAASLPEKYRASKYVFLANIAPDLQRDVLQQVKKRPKIAALDTMNYWIERTNEDLRARRSNTSIS